MSRSAIHIDMYEIDIIGTPYELIFYFLKVFEVENKYCCINSVMVCNFRNILYYFALTSTN